MLSSLSGRLLALTFGTAMLVQVAILVPSLVLFRHDWLTERLALAHVAALANLAAPEAGLDAETETELLNRAGIEGVVLRRDGSDALVLGQLIPRVIDETVDLRDAGPLTLFFGAYATMTTDGDRYIRVIGTPFASENGEAEVTLRAEPLKKAMANYSRRTIYTSLGLSAAVAAVLYLAARMLFLRPVRRLVANMTAFREDPDDLSRVLRPGRGPREIIEAERALAAMERDVNDALRQRARLAALGEAVARISHDLRNILASTQLFAERIETSRDPLAARIAPKLIGAIGRAITLCESTLRFGRAEEAPPALRRVALSALVDDVAEFVFGAADEGTIRFHKDIPQEILALADPDQLHRVFLNMLRNAREAIEASGRGGEVVVTAVARDGRVVLDLRDDGPGIPAAALESLFSPFGGVGKKGGAGLGLAIARDLVQMQGGRLELLSSTTAGTTFRLTLPAACDEGETATGRGAVSVTA